VNPPLNTAIPLNYRVPGIYFQFDFSGAASSTPNKSILLAGYRLSSGVGGLNEPVEVQSQADVDLISGARKTDLSRLYAAVTAQLRIGSGVRISVAALDEPSAGTAATHLLWFRAGPKTDGTIENVTAAQAPGIITVYECGWPIAVGVQQGDTFNDIAGNYLLARQAVQDYLPATASIIGEALTLGSSTKAMTFTALAAGQYLVITQKSAANQSTTATYSAATGILAIALGTDNAAAGNATPADVKTVLDGIGALAGKIGYSGMGGAGTIDYVYAQTLLAFATVVLTYSHKGLTGNTYPIRVEYSNTAMKVGVARAKVVIATNATGSSTHTISCNTGSYPYSPAASATPATVASAMAAALAARNFQLKGGVDSATLWLYYAPKRIVHRLTLATTDAAQTLTITDRVTGGALASVAVSTGNPSTLQGAGAPTLTTLLGAVAAAPAYLVWAHPFLDTASLSAIATHIEKYQDSPHDKGQTAHVTCTEKLSVAAALPLAPSPALTTSPRYVVNWTPGAWEQDWEITARTAALVAQLVDFPPKNYDGQVLVSGDLAPLHVPDLVERPTIDEQQAAMANYYLTPVIDDQSGRLAIVSDTTTWKPGDGRLTRWGGILTMDDDRLSLKARLKPVVMGKNIKQEAAYTPECVTGANILVAVKSWMVDRNKLDIYDGAESLFPQISGQGNPAAPQRYDIGLPMKWPQPLSIIGIKGFLA